MFSLGNLLSTSPNGRRLRHKVRDRISRYRKRPVVFTFPENVTVVASNACNFQCAACPKTAYKSDNRVLPPEVYERAKKQLLPHAKVINLQGLGEPMLSPLFFTMIRDAKQFGAAVEFVTNGSKITPENAREIVSSPSRMTISIDGACASTHERMRPGSNFEQLLQALGTIRSEISKPTAHPDFSFSVNTVVSRINIDELVQILEITASYGARQITYIMPAVGEDRTDAFVGETIGDHPQQLTERAPVILARADELHIRALFPPFVVSSKPDHPVAVPSLAARLFPQECWEPWRTIYIDVDGSVRPCCRMSNIAMGNILTDDFWTIWNNEHYLRLREIINSDAPPEICRGCSLAFGITAGDPDYMAKLTARGIHVLAARPFGLKWDKDKQRQVPA